MLELVKAFSKELDTANTAHEFLFLPNNPTDKENSLIDAAAAENSKIKKTVRSLEPLYATWNAGIEIASYPNITFWNVDDRRFVPAIIDGLKILNAGADVVYFPFKYRRYVKIFNISILAKFKTFVPPEFNLKRFYIEMHCGPFFMATKEAFRKAGGFDISYKISGDFEWQARAALKGLIFKRSLVVAGLFTNDGTTLSGSKSTLHQEENRRVYALSEGKK